MKPAQFDYVRAQSLEHAVSALAAAQGDGKLLAGGQSLVPMLNFRLLRPAVVIDINSIAELAFVEEAPNALRVGALTRHRVMETSPLVASHFPVIGAAMTHVAHLAVRNRGTVGGSLSHADPAAELPMLALLLDAKIKTAGQEGPRTIAAADFFVGALTTALDETEIVYEIELPKLPPNSGWAFEEVARRSGDFALAAVAAIITLSGQKIATARIAMTGVGDTPLRATAAEALLRGESFDSDAIERAAQAARAAATPDSDLHASADYRRHLVHVLTRRVIRTAWRRALGEPA